MNRYFGSPWDAPFIDDAVQVPTPVGEVCLTCDESVIEGEQGVVMPHIYLSEDGQTAARDTAQHRECMLLGVLGHLAGQCECFAGKGTPRERGRATVAWVEAMRG